MRPAWPIRGENRVFSMILEQRIKKSRTGGEPFRSPHGLVTWHKRWRPQSGCEDYSFAFCEGNP
jgi:hypothetical protein